MKGTPDGCAHGVSLLGRPSPTPRLIQAVAARTLPAIAVHTYTNAWIQNVRGVCLRSVLCVRTLRVCGR